MAKVTDIYGPIPYSKIGEDGKQTAPYDSEKDIYTQMFVELDEAIEVLSNHREDKFSPLADKVYGETMSALIKRKDVKTIREIRDYILEKYEKNLEERLILDDYGIVLVRPDTFECVDQYIAFLESKGLYVEYQKTIKIDTILLATFLMLRKIVSIFYQRF